MRDCSGRAGVITLLLGSAKPSAIPAPVAIRQTASEGELEPEPLAS